MYLLKQWVAGVAALLVFLPSTGFAAGIVLKNSMNSDIKAVFCVGNNGDKKPVVEGLAKKSSKTVSPAKFPEHDCTRIGVTMQNGLGWQYYYEPQPGSAKEIEFGMDAAGRNEKRKYPSMLITMPDGEAYVAPAGVPMFMLVQLMRKGMDVARWKEFALPGYDGLKEPALMPCALPTSRGASRARACNLTARAAGWKRLPCLRHLPIQPLGPYLKN